MHDSETVQNGQESDARSSEQAAEAAQQTPTEVTPSFSPERLPRFRRPTPRNVDNGANKPEQTVTPATENQVSAAPQTLMELTPSPSPSRQHQIWLRDTTTMIQQHYEQKLGKKLSKPHCCELFYQNQRSWFSGKQRSELEAIADLFRADQVSREQEENAQFEGDIERFEDIQRNGGC